MKKLQQWQQMRLQLQPPPSLGLRCMQLPTIASATKLTMAVRHHAIGSIRGKQRLKACEEVPRWAGRETRAQRSQAERDYCFDGEPVMNEYFTLIHRIAGNIPAISDNKAAVMKQAPVWRRGQRRRAP